MPQAAAFVAAKATALFIAKTGITSLIVAKAVYATAYIATTAAMIVGGNAIAKALAPEVAAPDRAVRVTVDSDEPVKIAVGRYAVAGSVKFTDTYDQNRRLGRILTLSDWPSKAITEIQMNRAAISPGAGGVVTGAPWNGKMTVQTRLGAFDQAAYSTLVSRSAYWTSAHRGRGVTDAFWEVEDDDKVWASGFPDPLFVGEWALVYDPRKDSTRGGEGAHRIDDPRTYEFSQNIALISGQYVYGFRARADDGSLHLRLGMGVSPAIINFASLAAAAARCDELVNGKPRYFGGGMISAADDPEDVLKALGAAMGGAIYQAGGLIEFRAAGPVPAEMVLTDDDLKGEIEYVSGPEFREAVNTLRVKFTDPAAGWKANATDAITEQAFRDQDGEVLEGEHAVYMAYDPDVVHRLGRLRLSELREPRRISAPFKAKAAKLVQGRAVIFKSARLGIEEKMFIEASGLDRSGGRTLQLVTETDAKYVAADDFTQALPVPPTADRYDPREVVTPEAEDWNVAALTIENGESKIPALAVTGGTNAAQVRRVKVEYRREGDTQWGDWTEAQIGTALRFEITGVAPGVAYEVAISYRNAAGVLGGRLEIDPETTPDVHKVPVSGDTDNVGGRPSNEVLSDLASAAQGVLDNAAAVAAEQTARIAADAAEAAARAQGLAAEAAQRGADIQAETNQRIQDVLDAEAAADAAVASEASARVSGDQANASDIAALGVRMGSAEAGVASNASAIATESSARASAVQGVSARFDVQKNLFPDPSGERNVAWSAQPPQLTRNEWSPWGGWHWQFRYYNGKPGAGWNFAWIDLPVTAGGAYVGQAWGAIRGCRGQLYLEALDQNKTQLAAADIFNVNNDIGESGYTDGHFKSPVLNAPAATRFIRLVAAVFTAAPTAFDTYIGFRQIKIEPGSIHTAFTDDASIGGLNAFVASEQSARVAGDQANASDIAALGVRMGSAEAGVASNASAIATESSARASAVQGVQANLDTEVSNRQAAVAGEQSARVSGDEANASDIAALGVRMGSAEAGVASNASAIASESASRAAAVSAVEARFSVKKNLFPDPSADRNVPWTAAAPEFGRGFWSQIGGHYWSMRWGGGKPNAVDAFAYIDIPVTVGGPYVFSAWAEAQRCQADLYIEALDGNKALLAFGVGVTVDGREPSPVLAAGHRYSGVANLPQATQFIRFVARVSNPAPTSQDTYIAFRQIKLEPGSVHTAFTDDASLRDAHAAVVSEAAARASADSAQASQISGLDARLGTAEAGVASNASAIATESSARSSQFSGLDARLGTAEAGVASNASAIASESSARASAISGVEARLNVKKNLFPDPSADRNIPWTAQGALGRGFWTDFGGNHWSMRWASGKPDAGDVFSWIDIPVSWGGQFVFSAWMAAQTCEGTLYIEALNASKVNIGSGQSILLNAQAPAPLFLAEHRYSAVSTFPPETRFVRLVARVRVNAPTAQDTYFAFRQIKLEPGSVHTAFSDDASLSEAHAAVTDVSEAVATLEGQSATRLQTVQAGAAFAGIQFVALDQNGNPTSDIRLAAQIVAFGPDLNTPKFVIDMISNEVYGLASDNLIKTLQYEMGNGRFRLRLPDGTVTYDSANGGTQRGGLAADDFVRLNEVEHARGFHSGSSVGIQTLASGTYTSKGGRIKLDYPMILRTATAVDFEVRARVSLWYGTPGNINRILPDPSTPSITQEAFRLPHNTVDGGVARHTFSWLSPGAVAAGTTVTFEVRVAFEKVSGGPTGSGTCWLERGDFLISEVFA